MSYIKLFEEWSNSEDITKNIENAEDISAYIPGHVGGCEQRWCLPNFDTKRMISNDDYNKYKGTDKKKYIRYYIVGFTGLGNFYKAASDIKHRSNVFGLKYFVINFNHRDHECRIVFFTKDDWDRLELKKVEENITKIEKTSTTLGWDILFEDDLIVDKSEFDTIYEDDDIMAIKPKSYRAAIKYSSDMPWKVALKKNLDWIEKYISKGSYYGGFNWYIQKNITKEVKNWWQKIFNLPGKQKDIQTKEFIQNFPRYLLYIVIFKKLPPEDICSRLYLLYDISRDEYGEMPKSFNSEYVMVGGYWGDKLDSAHNQLKIVSSSGKRITLRDVWNDHSFLFNRAFREIESDMMEIKDKMYDLLGFWADKGGEYTKDALVFIRANNKNGRLSITRPSLIKKDDKTGTITWNSLGYYDDPNFDWWELDRETQSEKELPKNGYKDYYKSMQDNIKKLQDALDKNFNSLGGTDFKL
jgi:hypothetical protein